MRVSDLISLGFDWLISGIVIAVIISIAFLIGYFFIYKKLCKGSKTLTPSVFLLYAMFFCYLVMVLGVTLLGRFNDQTELFRLAPFYTYIEAWNQFKDADWRNIILNIFMLVPFGFLLPYIAKPFKKVGWTTLAGFLFTLLIEATQLILKRGIFETDDLINNTLGVIIGYGFYRLVSYITDRIAKEPVKLSSTLLFQLPLLVTIVAFCTIFMAHNLKELGNLRCRYIIKAHPQSVTCNTDFDENTGTAWVYTVPIVSIEETRCFANDFFAGFDSDIDNSRTDVYDESVFYWNDDPDYTLSLEIDYEGNKIRYTNFNVSFGDSSSVPAENAAPEEVSESIKALGFYLPKGMTFTNQGYGKYLLDADCIMVGDYVYDGSVSCRITETGEIQDLSYNLIKCSAYKEFPIISEAEAYERIAAGIFRYEPAYEPDNIIVNDIVLSYEVDSKGFYQPIYIFECNIDGRDTRLYTPAIP